MNSQALKIALILGIAAAGGATSVLSQESPGLNGETKRPSAKLMGASETGDRTLQTPTSESSRSSSGSTTSTNGSVRSSGTASALGTGQPSSNYDTVIVDREQADREAARSERSSRARNSASSNISDHEIADQQVVIPLHEEAVRVEKRVVDDGPVRLRKIVKTETVNQPVELRREMLVVERLPRDRAAALNENANTRLPGTFEEGEIILSTSHEEPMVQKQVIEKDRIVARTNVESRNENVRENIRRETIEVVDRGNSRSVRVNGDLTKAAEEKKSDRDAQNYAQSSR